jgi:hypothetical protein
MAHRYYGPAYGTVRSMQQSLHKMPIAGEVSCRFEVARALHSTSRDVNVVNRNVLAALISAKDIVIPRFFCRGTLHVPDRDILDHDTIGRIARWTSVQIVLLNIDPIYRNIFHKYVLKQNTRYEAGRVRVGLYPYAVLCIENDRVLKNNVRDVIIRLSANGSNGEAMTSVTVHVGH